MNKNSESISTAPLKGALKLKGAAEYLGGLSEITVRRFVDRGLLHPNRYSRHLIFPIAELDRFLADGQAMPSHRSHKKSEAAQ
jgi:Helix-turn-helix domain